MLVTATRVLFRLKTDFSIADLPNSKHYNKALEGLIRATDKLVQAGKKVILLVDNPTLPDPKDCLDRTTSSAILNALLVKKVNERCKVDINRHLELSKKYRDLLNEVAQQNPSMIKILDPTSRLCDMEEGICRSHFNGHRLYRYTDHISDYAAGLIGKDINAFVTGLNNDGQNTESH